MQTFAPKDEREVAEAVSAAIADGAPLEVSGTRSKRGLGRPSEAVLRLNTAAMNGVSLYEPSELCLRAASGTPVGSIIALIAQQGQELAFEPMDYGPLLGAEPMSGTAWRINRGQCLWFPAHKGRRGPRSSSWLSRGERARGGIPIRRPGHEECYRL